MKLFKLLVLIVFLSGHSFAQTLFEDSLSTGQSSTQPVLNLSPSSASTSKVVIKKNRPITRLLSTNLESVIVRGDIQFLYEIPAIDGWSTIYLAHINPQDSFNDETGDIGAMAGGRLYMDGFQEASPIFLQGLMGFNHNNGWDLMISVEFGQRIKWKKAIFLDVSTVVNRSYASDSQDPTVYFKANLSFGLDAPLLPFL